MIELVRMTIRRFLKDRALRLSAALSFYTILSFAPILLIVVGVARTLGASQVIGDEIVDQMRTLIGPSGGEMASAVLQHADEPGKGVVSIALGLATLLFGATGVFVQLQDALNTIWGVERKPGGSVWSVIRRRLLSFAMILSIGFLLLVSLVLSASITLVQKEVATDQGWLWQLVNNGASLVVLTILFGLMFKILPDVKITWGNVVVGAVITGLLLTVGKYFIALYLGHSSVGSAYGAAGSLVVLLVWVYFSAVIVLFGAELTQAYASSRGTEIVPKPHARTLSR